MISILIFYFLLLCFSVLIFRNAYKIYKQNKDYTLLISTLIIYYFTLCGAWIFPIDSFFGFSGDKIGLHYKPIFERLFAVNFDTDYYLACSYYCLFILIFQYSYILFIKQFVKPNKIDINLSSKASLEVVINPYLILIFSLVCVFISAYIMKDEIYYAIAQEKSVYLITRANANPLYTIHQLANEFSVLIPIIAYSFSIFKMGEINIKIDNKKGAFQILLFSFLFASLYISFLGNRREILSGIVIFSLMNLSQLKRFNYKGAAYIYVLVFLLFLGNNFFRSRVIPSKLNAIFKLEKSKDFKDNLYDTNGIASSLLFSNELFYAHFSMYGVLHKDVPYTYGSSYKYLATSIIPRALYPNRPMDIYKYYATAVNATPGQIYTIHHATACYLNFGLLGLIFGGISLGAVFIFAFYINFYPFKNYNKFLILLKYLIPFLISAQLVTFITAGPEAYKSLILEGVVFPIFILCLCSKKNAVAID